MRGAPILTADEMRHAEAVLFATGISEYDVMERAGRGAAEVIWRAGAKRETLVLCGPGNNGGDGYVIARVLRERGVPVRVAAIGDPKTPSAILARANWAGPVEDIGTADPADQSVDCLFGTGLARGLDSALASRLGDLMGAARMSYAIDLPSGVATDSGRLLSPVPHFDMCVTIGALKPAHVLRPGAKLFDRLVCIDIGIDASQAQLWRLAKPRLAAPVDDAHKYTRGMVAVMAGQMAGASALAANAAAQGGAGYVKLIGAQAIVSVPHAIVRGRMGTLEDERIGCLLIGPGLGRADAARETLGEALSHRHAAVIDADALHHLANMGFDIVPDRAILTPHAGEFAVLFPDLDGTPIEQARAAASRANAVIVLKGPSTIIAAPDGRACVVDQATSWLSTAGTGDVLAGLCAARLASGGDPFDTACEAVWLH
ncbi:MAG: NAD(P)H-hydrate dehydratase, partial [Sphingobium sp.]